MHKSIAIGLAALPLAGAALSAPFQPVSDDEAADLFEQCLLDNGSVSSDWFAIMCCTDDFCVFCEEKTPQGTFTDCSLDPKSRSQHGLRPQFEGGGELAPPEPGSDQPTELMPVEPRAAPQFEYAD